MNLITFLTGQELHAGNLKDLLKAINVLSMKIIFISNFYENCDYDYLMYKQTWASYPHNYPNYDNRINITISNFTNKIELSIETGNTHKR